MTGLSNFRIQATAGELRDAGDRRLVGPPRLILGVRRILSDQWPAPASYTRDPEVMSA